MIGCGALHVMREDLAEVRTLATDPRWTGRGVRSALPSQLLCVANDLGLSHVFCLTFEVDFFAWNGFEVLEDTGGTRGVCAVAALLRRRRRRVLDLDRVKPNTLGNTRVLRRH